MHLLQRNLFKIFNCGYSVRRYCEARSLIKADSEGLIGQNFKEAQRTDKIFFQLRLRSPPSPPEDPFGNGLMSVYVYPSSSLPTGTRCTRSFKGRSRCTRSNKAWYRSGLVMSKFSSGTEQGASPLGAQHWGGCLQDSKHSIGALPY